MAGTYDDARLLVELAKLGAMNGLAEAASRLYAVDFDPDAVEANELPVSTVLGFFEIVATLVKHDLLNRELVHDVFWVPGVWERAGPAAERFREKMKTPKLYENVEWLATAGRN